MSRKIQPVTDEERRQFPDVEDLIGHYLSTRFRIWRNDEDKYMTDDGYVNLDTVNDLIEEAGLPFP